MELGEFVNELPWHTFNELRKVVVDRHQREAAEFTKVYQYLEGEATLSKAVMKKPYEVIRVLCEKTKTRPELCARVVERFLQLKERESKGHVETPFGDLREEQQDESTESD